MGTWISITTESDNQARDVLDDIKDHLMNEFDRREDNFSKTYTDGGAALDVGVQNGVGVLSDLQHYIIANYQDKDFSVILSDNTNDIGRGFMIHNGEHREEKGARGAVGYDVREVFNSYLSFTPNVSHERRT